MLSNRHGSPSTAAWLSAESAGPHGSVFRCFLAVAILAGSVFLPVSISGAAQDAGDISGFTPASVAAERQLEHKLRSIPDAAHAEATCGI